MNIPASNKEKLDLMRKIVSEIGHQSRDVSLVRDLISLTHYFEGMRIRRQRLEISLEKLAGLSQSAAIDKRWAKIHEIVFEFSSEITDASSAGASGGIGYQ